MIHDVGTCYADIISTIKFKYICNISSMMKEILKIKDNDYISEMIIII